MNAKKLARKARLLRWLLNCYPPYLGAGIRVWQTSADFRQARVKMGRSWYNRNSGRTQSVGSLCRMADPFYVPLIMESLGRVYVVWVKAAHIDFIAPGKGTVYAYFGIDGTLLDEIRQRPAGGDEYLPVLQVEVRDA